MSVPKAGWTHREVAPLELFFDLVFVLAIGQLTHHLIEHLTWRGTAETLALLVAVCGVWAFTSFEVTLLDIERKGTKAITVTVMGLGLFMNAGIAHAFDAGPWLFVLPMLLALTGPGIYAAATADVDVGSTSSSHRVVVRPSQCLRRAVDNRPSEVHQAGLERDPTVTTRESDSSAQTQDLGYRTHICSRGGRTYPRTAAYIAVVAVRLESDECNRAPRGRPHDLRLLKTGGQDRVRPDSGPGAR